MEKDHVLKNNLKSNTTFRHQVFKVTFVYLNKVFLAEHKKYSIFIGGEQDANSMGGREQKRPLLEQSQLANRK